MQGTTRPARRVYDNDCEGDPGHCPFAREAADIAVKKVFAILGVDVNIPKDIEEFRKDLRFGQSMRNAANKGIMAIVGLVALGVVGALWAGFKIKVGG